MAKIRMPKFLGALIKNLYPVVFAEFMQKNGKYLSLPEL